MLPKATIFYIKRNYFSNLKIPSCRGAPNQYQIRFGKKCRSEDFKSAVTACGHLGHCNEAIIATMKLCVASIPPPKFQYNPAFSLEGEMILIVSK